MRNVEHLPLTETQRERSEWEVLALNIFRHPLSPYRTALRDSGVTLSERIKELPHGTRAHAAGLLECLQCPPTKSGRPVCFLLIEDERGLLQATIFRGVYETYGNLLHHRGAFLLEGRVENTPEKGFSFVVEYIEDLRELLVGAKVPTPKAYRRRGRSFEPEGEVGRRDSHMSQESLVYFGPTAVSLLALVLSLVNLYLQRRDRRPHLEIRVRYEYRIDTSDGTSNEDAPPPLIHDDSQEGLYLLLGNFLREHGLEYPQGTPVVRFALSNKGDKVVYLDGIRLVFRTGNLLFGDRLVLDPTEDRVLPLELAEGVANILVQGGRLPVELVPGDSAGYRFELIRLANTLTKEGHTGSIRMTLEATDRLGNTYRRPFGVNTDLWAYPEGQ